MSRLFGPMRQVGIVVRDIEKAMRHWVEVCGIGPWFYAERLPLDGYRYKGKSYDIPNLSIALANSGEVQLELIQQRCRTPSLYWDFIDAGHEGMQHWSSWPENYHEIRERALRSGQISLSQMRLLLRHYEVSFRARLARTWSTVIWGPNANQNHSR